jgi:hypothetical protein
VLPTPHRGDVHRRVGRHILLEPPPLTGGLSSTCSTTPPRPPRTSTIISALGGPLVS